MLISDEACPYCATAARRTLRDRSYRVCGACGLIFRGVLPPASTLDELYAVSWVDPEAHRSETGGTEPRLAEVYAAGLLNSVGLRDFGGLNVLDFGAGRGEMAVALASVGAHVLAVDPYAKRFLRSRGLDAVASLDEIPGDRRFDGIVALDVIEHLPAPWDVLTALRDRLNPSGWLFLSTPNAAGLSARVLGPRWSDAVKPGHLFLFTWKSLRAMLSERGYANPERTRLFVDYSDAGWRRGVHRVMQFLEIDGVLRCLARAR